MALPGDLAVLVKTGAYEVINHQAPAPDPKDEKYIKHTAQVIGAERFNDMPRPVRRVTISGVHLCFDTTDRRGVIREYNGKEDIKELYIVADTVVISRALRFPQTDVFITCRALEFNGAEAAIDTTPKPIDKDYRELLDKNGRNGLKAGNITLSVSKITVDAPGLRFIARGAEGQEAEEGEISATSMRKDLQLITKEEWEGEKGFCYAHRHVTHEATAWGKGENYTADMLTSDCDWETFQRLCGRSITYVKFTNEFWVDGLHEKRFGFQGDPTTTKTIFELGTTELPGEGGAGMPPGKPGTGGAGGNLIATVPIDPRLRDLTGGASAPTHPGTRGGAGGTPKVAGWVFMEGKPEGRGEQGKRHVFPHRTERKLASEGKASGPGPAADKPKGDDGKDIALWSQPDAKDKCAAGWITPLLLNIVTQYAKDVATAEQTERAQALLKPYLDALTGRTNEAITFGFPEEVVGGSHTMAQLRDEVTGLMARLDQHLDSFGNPPGWVPNLTLTGAVGAYDAVRDIALKELYGAYYLEKAWKAKETREKALKQLIDVLIEKTRQLKAQMIDTRRAIMQRGYVPPTDPTAVRDITVDDLAGAKPLENVPFNDMSLLERLRSLVAQMEALEQKRKAIETRLRAEADEKTTSDLQWEAVQAGLKISGAVLKSLPLPPPYEQAAAAFGGLLDVTSTFMERGGDDAAFAELKNQVTNFTDTNQEKLVGLFTKSMDEELSAYNDQIKDLEQAAKTTQKAKDEIKQQYDEKVNTASAERDAAVKALTDRTQQRLRQRQVPDPARTPINFKEAIASRALEIKSGADVVTKASQEYGNKKAELDQQSKTIETTTQDLQKKVKATTEAKEARAESTKKNIENVKKVVDGIEQIAKAVNKLAVSETQLNSRWNEALARIKSKDSEFQTYLTQVTYLNEQKKLVVGRLVKLLNDLQDQQRQIARNLVAINELRLQYAKGGADDLDQGTLLYIQGMREDAHRRLTTFLYYVTRAYEYYTVRPWNQFYADARKIFEDLRVVLANPAPNLTGIFDTEDKEKDAKEKKLKALITAPTDPVLSESDFALLKGIYEKPLRDMGIRMLDELASGRERRSEEREQHVTLRSDDLRGLNRRIRDRLSAHLTVNLARLDQIRSGDEKQRLGGFKVVKAVGRRLSPRFPDDITFKVTHVGRSIVCYQGKLYAFEPQAGAEAGGRSRGVTFETNATAAKVTPEGEKLTLTGEALKQPEAKAQETLVSKLLGPSASGGIDLSEFRPGAFSDFLLSVEFTPRECAIEFDEIEFVVMMEKGNTDSTAELVSIFNDRDLAVDIRTSRADRSGRNAAIGRYFGVYNDNELEIQPLVITVPAEYGRYRHTGWSDGAKGSAGNPHTRSVSAGARLVATYEPYMKERPFGRTGIRVSEIAFGGGAVGGILIDSEDAVKREAVRRALDAGVNWFDTAAKYGDGKSEQAVGSLLTAAGATPHLSTKFELDVETLRNIPAEVEKRLRESLARLKRPSVDLLQLHNRIGAKPGGRVLTVEQILGKNGVADGLQRLKEKGLIRYMGITAIGETTPVCEVLRSKRFDSAQVYYNLLNPSAGRSSMPSGWRGENMNGIMGACRENNVAVMAIRVFAAGVIATDQRTGRESVLLSDASIAEDERRTKAVFDAIGDKHGTRAQVALRFVLSNPDVSCAVIGVSELRHIDEAVAAVDMGPLPADVVARLDALYARDFGRA